MKQYRNNHNPSTENRFGTITEMADKPDGDKFPDDLIGVDAFHKAMKNYRASQSIHIPLTFKTDKDVLVEGVDFNMKFVPEDYEPAGCDFPDTKLVAVPVAVTENKSPQVVEEGLTRNEAAWLDKELSNAVPQNKTNEDELWEQVADIFYENSLLPYQQLATAKQQFSIQRKQ